MLDHPVPTSEPPSHGHAHHLHAHARPCRTCGQTHPHHEPHVYDYAGEVDEDLTCHICLQPFVIPLDTPCGHTFCQACLLTCLEAQSRITPNANHSSRGGVPSYPQQLCPIDRKPLSKELCLPSSIVLRKLLEKLTVRCPNNSVCQAILPRGQLEDHLKYRCEGCFVNCVHAPLGCALRGPGRTVRKHQTTECQFGSQNSNGAAVGGGIGGAAGANGNSERTNTPLLPHDILWLELSRPSPTQAWGISVVGGADTPLRCLVIQTCGHPNGRVLRPGDQLVYLDQTDLTPVTHLQFASLLRKAGQKINLGVYRDTSRKRTYPAERLVVTLRKVLGQALGIRLTRGPANSVSILEVIEDSVADQDGRLKPADVLLTINGEEAGAQNLELASQLIQSREIVVLEVKRTLAPQGLELATPAPLPLPPKPRHHKHLSVSHSRAKSAPEDLIRFPLDAAKRMLSLSVYTPEDKGEASSARSQSCETLDDSGTSSNSSLPPGVDLTGDEVVLKHLKEITIVKKCGETLGLRIGGGLRQHQATCVYVSNLHPDGCVSRAGTVKRGDVLLAVGSQSLVGISHQQAVVALKSTLGQAQLCLNIYPAPEFSPGPELFTPTWLYWQQLPDVLQFPKHVELAREDDAGSWGFSVVGGARNDDSDEPEPIHVLLIVPDSPAGRSGALRCGDRLLAVDNQNLQGLDHSRAVVLLKATGQTIKLLTLSWPGTEL